MFGEWGLVPKALYLLVHLMYVGMLLVTEASWHGTACMYMLVDFFSPLKRVVACK